MDAIPLAPDDRAILDLEGPTIAGHTCKVIVVGKGAPDVARLRAAVAPRLEAVPALRRRLGGAPDAPVWVADEAFDIANHVVDAPVPGAVGAEGLRTAIARLFEQRLDRGRPLWRIDRVPLDTGAAALVWRIHHALADGTAAMRFAREVLWDAQPGAPAPAGAAKAAAHAAHAADDARRRAHLAGFIRREFARSLRRSPFEGLIGAQRQVSLAAVPLAPLAAAAKRLDGATINDAVLAVVAGTLRRWLVLHHGSLGGVRVRVPVSLHHEGDDAANHDSFFTFALPLNEPDPATRLRAVHAATSARKAGRDAELFEHLNALAAVSPALRRFTTRMEESPRKFAVSVSNVPGPRDPVTLLGAPVEGLYTLAEIGEQHGLRVAIVSLAGTLSFGFCADPSIVEDVQALADGVLVEADALVAAAG